MGTPRHWVAVVVAVALLSMTLCGCGGDDTPDPTPAPGPAPGPAPTILRWAFGKGEIVMWDGTSNTTLSVAGKITWAVEVPGKGLALCDETRDMLSILDLSTMTFTEVALAPLKQPVGAVMFENKIWVAAFNAGLAVVDPFEGTLDAHYPYPLPDGSQVFVHNVYVMNWDGQPEIFAAVIGNPWSSPPVDGDGLVLFDRTENTFVTNTTSSGLHARSAVQKADGSVFVLAQQPPGGPSRLVNLVKDGSNFAISGEKFLPARTGGDGGADVFLGPSDNEVFVTDRTGDLGKLYYFNFNDSTSIFDLKSTRETGKNPRYTTAIDNGDIVACNQGSGTLSTFTGLAKNPWLNVEATESDAVPEVSFFLTTVKAMEGSGAAFIV